MRIEQTPLVDCFIVHEKVHGDARGYFIETFNQRDFNAASGLDISFVQDNQSRSSKGVLRGLHMQRGSSAQAKLVRVLEGAVLDVVVDLRKGSPSFGQHFTKHQNGGGTANQHKGGAHIFRTCYLALFRCVLQLLGRGLFGLFGAIICHCRALRLTTNQPAAVIYRVLPLFVVMK